MENNSTYKIEIPKSWWDHFTNEAICEDAEIGSDDWILDATGQLLEMKPYAETQKVWRYEVTEQQLRTLHHHADWYAWFWKEECASWGDDTLMWHAWARGSRAFANKLASIMEAQS